MIRIGDNAILESGTATFRAGHEKTGIISLSRSDRNLEPVITATPLNEHGDINIHLDTTVEFNNSTKKWQFIIHRSIGANTNNDVGAEAMTVIWKAICLENIRQVGGTVTVANEPH
tara:strand:- start:327 stop:674 length:348 start_codon:yes stop_codon:yes gene_type:complete